MTPGRVKTIPARDVLRRLGWRAALTVNTVAWFLSLRWMLATDPSNLTFRSLLPMFTFALVATVTITYLLVTGLEWLNRRYPPRGR